VAEGRAGPVRPSSEREYRRVKPFIRLMSWANKRVFQLSGGRLGNKFLRGAPVGLLTTVGRKSGQPRTTPLIYLEDGDRIVLVASQGGLPHHPIWYLNLEADPDAEFQVGRDARRLRARRASDAEKRDLWPRLCSIYPDYDDYQRRTERNIPVVILEPR
jgi:deazaflavin-dependent oxidoreductase (nitroreductase family)